MAAKDLFHDMFKEILERDGWTITHDPLIIKIDEIKYEIDLGAEKIIGAEKGKEKIAIEIKSFLHSSFITDFHRALGQYLNYKVGLRMQGETDRELYLALPDATYENYFKQPLIEEVIKLHQIKLIVFNDETKKIALWKK